MIARWVASLDDLPMMRRTIKQRGGHLGVTEGAWPFAESQIGDQDRGLLVEAAEQVEEQLPARLRDRQIAGAFENGRGEFYDQEPLNGRMVLARQVWSDITPTSHHLEQSFSDDGGKTWIVNFVADLTKQR